MAKDYSDYILTVYGAGERVYDDIHVRIVKPKKGVHTRILDNDYILVDDRKESFVMKNAKVPSFKLRTFEYLFDGFRDRAYRTKLAPWKKWDNKHIIGSLRELARSKKIGHLHYREPCTNDCAGCKKSNDPRYELKYPNCPKTVEPIHISKIHQPSGRLETEPAEKVLDYDGNEIQSLVEQITPFTFKTIVDNRFYMQAYKSFKFGFRKGLTGKWWVYALIGGGVLVAILLFATGTIPMG